jgi:hypothetical protein
MGIHVDVLWQHGLMTMASGLAILVAVVSGFAIFGFVCGIFCEFCTRKEETERRNKNATAPTVSTQPEEAEAVSVFRRTSGLSVVADV